MKNVFEKKAAICAFKKSANLVLAAIFAVTLAIVPSQAQTFRAIHQFNSQNDGFGSEGSVLVDATGNLFGTTTTGAGGLDSGIVFKIDSSGKESVLFNFDTFISGIFPTGSLVQDQSGNIYGVAEGGPGGAGVVYRVSQQGDQQVLFAFQGGLNNHTQKAPAGGLFLDKNGNIFGTAEFGTNLSCQLGCGTIFRLDSAGQMHILHTFTGDANGAQPVGPLVRDAAGNFYGVTKAGGNRSCPEFDSFRGSGCGVVFKLSKTGQLTVLHTFNGGQDGALPQGGLLLDAAGNLFGTTASGGNADRGTIFRIAKDGTFTVLHRFALKEAKNPNGGLVADAAGNLFGTAQLGGDQNLGSVFELTPNGTLNVLHSFQGLEDGAVPFAGLTRDSAGHLFGTTVKNFLVQQIQGGNVFEITP